VWGALGRKCTSKGEGRPAACSIQRARKKKKQAGEKRERSAELKRKKGKKRG
jgi:hypothetical protein